jgi:hypothetical protein
MRNCTKLVATLFNTRTCALFTRVWCSNLTWHDVDIVLFFSLFSHNAITSKVAPFSLYLVSLKVCMQVWTSRNSKFPSLGAVSCHREVWVLHGQKRWGCCTACTVCLYNRLQQYYADLFFTVNNIEKYYSSWMGCNNVEQYCCNLFLSTLQLQVHDFYACMQERKNVFPI